LLSAVFEPGDLRLQLHNNNGFMHCSFVFLLKDRWVLILCLLLLLLLLLLQQWLVAKLGA